MTSVLEVGTGIDQGATMKDFVRSYWTLILGCLLLVGCGILPSGVKIEACLDHPKYGQVCAMIVDGELYIKHKAMAGLPEDEKAVLIRWAKEQLEENK